MTRSNMRCLRATLTYATLLTISLGLDPTVKAAPPGVVEQPIVPVFVTKLQQRPLTRSLEIPATLRADQRADLFAYVSGYVTAVHVDIGDHVKRGDSLLEISVPEMRDELRRAAALLGAKRAHVAVAKATLDLQKITTRRQEDLAREKAISRQALDEALGQLTRVQALLLKPSRYRIRNRDQFCEPGQAIAPRGGDVHDVADVADGRDVQGFAHRARDVGCHQRIGVNKADVKRSQHVGNRSGVAPSALGPIDALHARIAQPGREPFAARGHHDWIDRNGRSLPQEGQQRSLAAQQRREFTQVDNPNRFHETSEASSPEHDSRLGAEPTRTLESWPITRGLA